MGNDCFTQKIKIKLKQSKMNQGQTKSGSNKRPTDEPRSLRQTNNQNIQLRATKDRQRSLTPNKIKRIQDLQKKRQTMIDKESLAIKQKQQSIKKVNEKIEQLTSNGNRDDLKLAKLQRQVKVLQDCIKQHERNIQKIKKADSQITTQ